ncbi:MAG: hypothetical protein JXO72_16275 [Vicinamibacteria bacterium]|nr:hypothetical protein [Vicinamibacteria bacterium]
MSPATEVEGRPRAVCSARLAGDRVVATIELHSFLDDDLLALIRLGMEGRVRVQASVMRKRLGLFEQDLATQSSDSRIGYSSGERQYVINGRVRIRDPARFTAGRVSLRLKDPDVSAMRLTFRAEVRLQVVTESSLSRVAAWVTESGEESTSGSILARGLLSAVAEDLVRTTECSCLVERPQRSNP